MCISHKYFISLFFSQTFITKVLQFEMDSLHYEYMLILLFRENM